MDRTHSAHLALILSYARSKLPRLCHFPTYLPSLLGNALLRRLVRIGVLDESKMKLDYVLGLRIEDFLERRLQTQVFKLGNKQR